MLSHHPGGEILGEIESFVARVLDQLLLRHAYPCSLFQGQGGERRKMSTLTQLLRESISPNTTPEQA